MRGDVARIESLYLELGKIQSIVHPLVSAGVGELGMPDGQAIAIGDRKFCHFLLRELIFSMPCVKIYGFLSKYIFCSPLGLTNSCSCPDCLQRAGELGVSNAAWGYFPNP